MSKPKVAYIHLTVLVNSEDVEQTKEELHARVLWHPTTVEVLSNVTPTNAETISAVESGKYRTMQDLLNIHTAQSKTPE